MVPEDLSPLVISNFLNEISLWTEKEYPILESNYSVYVRVCVCVRVHARFHSFLETAYFSVRPKIGEKEVSPDVSSVPGVKSPLTLKTFGSKRTNLFHVEGGCFSFTQWHLKLVFSQA